MWGMFPMYPTMLLPRNCDLPPTLYSILESIVNFDVENKTKISELASAGRTSIFDFEYPLSSKVDKEDFETLILNKFMMRRIGFDTVTSFKIHLNVKLNEIMPNYNKLFDMLGDWNLFSSGEVITRELTKTGEESNEREKENTNNGLNTATNTRNAIEDLRYSDTPENEIDDVQDGKYVSEYNYNTSSDTSSVTNNTYLGSNETENSSKNKEDSESETITRTNADKIKIYKEFLENRTNIMTLIFKDLDELFYGLV